MKIAYFISVNQIFSLMFRHILVFYNLCILFWEKWTKTFLTAMILVDLELDKTLLLQQIQCIGFKKSLNGLNHISQTKNFLWH